MLSAFFVTLQQYMYTKNDHYGKTYTFWNGFASADIRG